MPIHIKSNNLGKYFQWGNHGAKYYFDPKNKKSIMFSYNKAVKQAQAAYSHGYKEKKSKKK